MAKKICLYGIFAALCITAGYIEHLVNFDFIAPGIKLGLANSVAMMLIVLGDIKGAFAVNTVRIILSALLFSTPLALVYSLSGGLLSLAVMAPVSKIKSVSIYGMSILGAEAHNLAQLVCGSIFLGAGIWYYSGILITAALLCGILTAAVSKLLLKKLKTDILL